jgi:hypothetical protein
MFSDMKYLLSTIFPGPVIGCFDFGDEEKGKVFNEVLERWRDFLIEKVSVESLLQNFPYYSKVNV